MYQNEQFELLKKVYNSKKIEELDNLINKIEIIFKKYNKEYYHYTNNYIIMMENTFNSLKINHLIHMNDGGTLSNYVAEKIDEIIKTVENYYNRIKNLKYLEFLSEEKKSIIFVGPNGSGKTTLLRKLIDVTGQDKIGYYPADRLMIITESYKPERNYDNFFKQYEDTDNYANDINNYSQSQYISEQLDKAIALFEKKRAKETEEYMQKDNGDIDKNEYATEKILNIWNSLIEDRKLFSDGNLKVKTLDGQEYPIKYLSSGEKSIFYFLTCIFLKERKEYYFIDEPENNLNPSIVSKLWDIIEEHCIGSIFVYLTHDSNFVESRTNSKIYWIEKYDGKEWKYEKLPANDDLPQNLIVSLVGSRKPILFCESHDEYKYDDVLFKMMFEEFNVVPSGGCDSVIEKVKAYSKVGLPQKAIGIIDCDYRTEDFLTNYKKQKIYVLPFFEIENFLMCEDIVRKIINNYSNKPEVAFSNVKKKLKENLISKKEQWIIRRIGFYLKNNSFNKKINSLKKFEELEKEYLEFQKEIDLKKLYKEFEKEIDKIIALDDYDKFLQYYDSKGMFKEDFRVALDLKDNISYEDIVFKYLKNNKEILSKLRDKYFPEIKVY